MNAPPLFPTDRRNGVIACCIITCLVVAGLLADQTIDFWGQTLTNVTVWALFLYWLQRANKTTQVALVACVIYATAGEIFLSLVWGLYDYRLGAVPLFVPPGHALLFMLGGMLANCFRQWIVWAVPVVMAPLVAVLLVSGSGTLDALLFAVFLLCLKFGRAPKLYAVMFVLSLAMELYGTWLGNWTWSSADRWFGLTTLNPPLAAGAFYCVLDLLVVATAAGWRAKPWPLLIGGFRRLFQAWRPVARLWARNARTAQGI